MRSKKVLTLLLAVCMLLSVVSPAAYAVGVGADAYVSEEQSQSNAENSTVMADAPRGALNLRDNPITNTEETEETGEPEGEGTWSAAPVENGEFDSLALAELPECVEELREAAEYFDVSERVAAFVVMEAAPLAETYSSITKVAPTTQSSMLAVQDAVIEEIETQVLDGNELEVRYQFTYLTNSFSIETEFGNLEEIAMMDGVKSVFVMPVYYPAEAEAGNATPSATASGEMVGVPSIWEDLGYTGSGMKIAVLDTGLDLDHPSFAAAPQSDVNSLTVEDIAAVLEDLNAYDRTGGSITAEELYNSEKVPFVFNYSDSNLIGDHSRDNQGDHGTHVAGIAAANANVEGTEVVGMAPDAQIIVMKVFGATRAGAADDLVAALEDAMLLGCDVANLSLGSTAGFTSADNELDLIYERIAAQDIIVAIAAGNDNTSSYQNMWGTDLNTTEHPDNATINSPSIYANATAVGSANNANGMSAYFAYGDTKVAYTESRGLNVTFNSLASMGELEFAVVPGLGEAADYEGLDVAGKVVLVKRGTINFSLKLANAEANGAVGLIVYDNVNSGELFAMDMTDGSTGTLPEGVSGNVPAVTISLPDGEAMIASQVRTLTVSATDGIVPSIVGGQVSSFSSWGVAPDLSLAPDITGIGGNVYSTIDAGQYGVMNGTSMATPQIAGISALVMEYLYDIYPNSPDGSIRQLAENLLMSTSEPIVSTASGVEASPRQQGSGLVNAMAAVTSEAYLTVGGHKPEAELGDGTDGRYTFSFEIHNFSDVAKTYTLDSSLLTEDITTMAGIDFMAEQGRALSGSVEFSKDTVTVPAGKTVNVTVTVTLSAEDKAWIAEHFENGIYVEGFVYLNSEDENGVDLSLPFLGFYGDWTDAPVFDTAFWYDNSFFGYSPADGLPEGNEYYNIIWTSLGGSDWVLGMNPYTGAVLGEDGKIAYDPAHNSVSPNGDGILDGIEEMYLSLMRNAKTLTFTYTANGEVVHEETVLNASKTCYRSAYGSVVPWIYSWYGSEGFYDFSALESGTQVMLTIRATVDYGTGGDHVLEIPITVDTNGPELVGVSERQEDGRHYLTVEMTDEVDVAFVQLTNATGTRVLGEAVEYETAENGTLTAEFDITGLGTEFMVALCDYAANESYYKLTYTSAEDGNLPELDGDMLYAYRIHDQGISSDDMYGWVQFAKTHDGSGYIWVGDLTNDKLETYALTAAEYVDGLVFAVDAGYNLVVMEPGLWDRTVITNLGYPVLDMAFDDTTDTMYMVTRKGGSTYTELQKLDLATGEVTMLKNYGYQTRGLYSIAVGDDGTLYATRHSSSNLFTVDKSTYAMTAVKDADGNTITFYDYMYSAVKPNYSQSMTFADGKLYWAYFNGSSTGNVSELLTIDPSDNYSYTHAAFARYASDGNPYQSDNELVGLLTLDATDYELPEAEQPTRISLDTTDLVLTVGQSSSQLKVSPTPWNAPMGEITWTSSDEAVATVADGIVTGTGGGSAVITAHCGELTAQCAVTVVDAQGSFYAYNYYSGDGTYGNMLEVVMPEMERTTLLNSTVDFIAGDYNGHDGKFYGYTEVGQLYAMDMTTGETSAVGTTLGKYPADMAYDYTTGTLYAMFVDQNLYKSTLYAVNMRNGQLVELGAVEGIFLWTLACDDAGLLYSIATTGELFAIDVNSIVKGADYGYPYDILQAAMVQIMGGLGNLSYAQSMCYDHANGVLLWAPVEYGTIAWIDVKAATPFIIPLGDPTGTGLFEYVGMHTVPEVIMELPAVAVESVTAEDMTLMSGAVAQPAISILPANADDYTVELVSGNETVVTIDEQGNLMAVSGGEATVTYTVTDNAGEGNTFTGTFSVTVIQSADNMFGFVGMDLATMVGSFWAGLNAADPMNYAPMASFGYMVYSAEHHDGKLYAYGFDDASGDFDVTFQYFVLDPETYAIQEQHDMGAGFPYVYDMTYDYATSTMYAVASPTSSGTTDLFMVNMENGQLVRLMETGHVFQNLAAGADGVLYAMEYGTLYAIDPVAQTIETVGSTGVASNVLSSMSYDYDTDTLYWTPLDSMTYAGGLYIVDTETAEATHLGSIGAMGSQFTGLFFLCDEYPAEGGTELINLSVTPGKVSMNVGETVQLTAITLPMSLDAELSWKSSNSSVASVDENGLVTALKQGSATITVTATDGTNTLSVTSTIAVLDADAGFLTYNITDGGWALISRQDVTKVTNLTEASGEAVPSAIASVGNAVYGFDVENSFFSLNTETYERTVIGNAEAVMQNITLYPDQGMTHFMVRDLAYDAANDRFLALGVRYGFDEYGTQQDFVGGAAIYEVNMETGVLELVHTILDEYMIIHAMTVDADGIIYIYNTYDQYYTSIDLTAGVYTDIATGSSLSANGDDDGHHELYFDSLSGLIYHLFTSNSTFNRIYTLDPATKTLTLVEFVGEVILEGRAYKGDTFSGLTFVFAEEDAPEHECDFGEPSFAWNDDNTCVATVRCECGEAVSEVCVVTSVTTVPSCDEDGKTVYTAVYGEYTSTREVVIPMTGHSYGEPEFVWNEDYTAYAVFTCGCGDSYTAECDVTGETVKATCEENGKTVYTAVCGEYSDTVEVVIKATGHNYRNNRCTVCGEKKSNGWIGGWFDDWFGGWWGDKDEPTEPSVPETTEPTEPETSAPTEPSEPEEEKPSYGGGFGWIGDLIGKWLGGWGR